MYSFHKHKHDETVWTDDKSEQEVLIEAQMDAKIKQMQMEIELRQIEHDRLVEKQFRDDIGLSLMESDAKALHAKLVEAAIELAFVIEMDKNDYVTEKAKRKVVNTRSMYNAVRKRIFKVCLKHGVKSEHSKRS